MYFGLITTFSHNSSPCASITVSNPCGSVTFAAPSLEPSMEARPRHLGRDNAFPCYIPLTALPRVRPTYARGAVKGEVSHRSGVREHRRRRNI